MPWQYLRSELPEEERLEGAGGGSSCRSHRQFAVESRPESRLVIGGPEFFLRVSFVLALGSKQGGGGKSPAEVGEGIGWRPELFLQLLLDLVRNRSIWSRLGKETSAEQRQTRPGGLLASLLLSGFDARFSGGIAGCSLHLEVIC